ncbi:efflux RND transporter permease subunit [Haliovirga abyssi]|uniref:SSD domain-containing protein n=1 Tax=Haliovirga abyssi TaxID=2996794 RepID=A0AAU9DVB7_9FUSO|nr:efflux RND transporter permease subunit [Haliovirga abyssi]BDU51324.1 hypothetical protein HLVA_18930 [Haliovirga abyssi]
MLKLLKKIYKHPIIIFIVMILLTVGSLKAIKSNGRLETNLDEYMPKDNPAFVYSDKAEEWFNIKDGVIIAIENKNGVINSETLQKVKDITKALQKYPKIKKADVVSLYTAENIVGDEYGMEVNSFFKRVPKTESKLEKLKENVKNNNMIFGKLVSKNYNSTLIIAELDKDIFSQKMYKDLKDMASKYNTGSDKIYIAGRPVIEGSLALLAPKDMKKMIPIVILVIIIVLYLTLRTIKGTIITLLIVLFSAIWAFGLMTYLKIPIYSISTMIPVMLIAIGVADGIHIFSHIKHYTKESNEKDNKLKKEIVIEKVLSELYKPVIMTSITTAVGFLSLLTSQVYPVKYFGIFTAFGVLFAMVLSLMFLPASVFLFGLPHLTKKEKSGKAEIAENSFMDNITEKILKSKLYIVGLTVIIVVISIYGMSKIWVDSSFLSKFEKNSNIVKADTFINNNFGGTTKLNIIFEGKENDFKNPEILKKIDDLQAKIEKIDGVGATFSLTDYLKRMNLVMNGDKEGYYTIPSSRDLIAQYLLLYSMSGDPENLNKVIDYNYKKLNMQLQLKSDNSKLIRKVIDVVKNNKNEFKGIKINYAGSAYKSLVFTDLILEGQIQSLGLSLILIGVLIAFMFKSVVAGFIGIIPIALTALTTFGVMGFLKIPLSSTTALLSSISIGIGVDYAIHFIDRYKMRAAGDGNEIEIAKHTMEEAGKAIFFNAVVVILGFSVLMFSVFPPNRELGALISFNMFVAFVSTLTIMLIAINTIKPKFIFKDKKEK